MIKKRLLLLTGYEHRYSMELYADTIHELLQNNEQDMVATRLRLRDHWIKKLDKIRILWLPIKYIFTFLILIYELRKYDILHIVDHSYGYICTLKILYPNLKIIVTVHDLTPLDENGGKFRVSIAYRFSIYMTQYADFIICPSQQTLKTVLKLYPKSNTKIRVFKHGVQIPNLSKIAAFVKLNRKKKLAIGFCSGGFYKNVNFTLRICNYLGSKYEIELRILGPQTDELLEFELSNNRIKFVYLTAMSALEIAKYYDALDFLLFPSLAEGLGQPLIEAMRMSCPVYASDIPVFQEVTSGNYPLFPCKSVQEIDEFISIFSAGDSNPKIINAGIAASKEYNWNVFIEEYKVLFDKPAVL